MEVLPKDIIRTWILPCLTQSPAGGPSRVEPVALLYKLKTGCQWRYLPVKQFFTGAGLTWQGVYARFNKWRKDGSWKKAWLTVLRLHKHGLGCSSVQLDGCHTTAKNGGAAVGCQGRKKARTTTALFLTDNRDQPLACTTPQAGNHHNSFRLAALFEELCVLLEAAGIALNALVSMPIVPSIPPSYVRPAPRGASKPTLPATAAPPSGRPTTTRFSTPNSTADAP